MGPSYLYDGNLYNGNSYTGKYLYIEMAHRPHLSCTFNIVVADNLAI